MPSKHKQPKKMARKAPGSILIAVIISCAVLLILLGTLASFAELLQSQSGRQIRDFQASYLAEAEVNYIIATDATGSSTDPIHKLGATDIDGTISYIIVSNGVTGKSIMVKAGVPKNNPLTCRTVRVVVDSSNHLVDGGYDLSPSGDCSTWH